MKYRKLNLFLVMMLLLSTTFYSVADGNEADEGIKYFKELTEKENALFVVGILRGAQFYLDRAAESFDAFDSPATAGILRAMIPQTDPQDIIDFLKLYYKNNGKEKPIDVIFAYLIARGQEVHY